MGRLLPTRRATPSSKPQTGRARCWTPTATPSRPGTPGASTADTASGMSANLSPVDGDSFPGRAPGATSARDDRPHEPKLAERPSSHTIVGGRRRLTYRGRSLIAGTLRGVSRRAGGVGSGKRLCSGHVTGFNTRSEDCRRGSAPHSFRALPRILHKRTLASEDVT